MSKEGAEKYTYTRLQDAALSVGKKVNIYGVVGQYDHPKVSLAGGSLADLYCRIVVKDMSMYSPGLTVRVFSSTTKGIPQVRAIGDVIRFHRAVIENHNGIEVAIVSIKKGGSFLILDGASGTGYTPYQESSEKHTMEAIDHQKIDLLRHWVKRLPMDIGPTDYFVRISDIREGSFFDLCCKILYTDNRKANNVIILYVWDGTDAPPASVTISRGREVQQNMSKVGINIEGIPSLTRDVISSFPPVGSVLPMVLNPENIPIPLHSNSNWIKFRNVTCCIHLGLYELCFVKDSKISLLSPHADMVMKCESESQRRIVNVDSWLPQSVLKPFHSITVTDYKQVHFSTLREVLTYPEVTYKFHCVVRVIATLPTAVQDFCVPVDSEMLTTYNECQGKSYVYRVRLTLEDPTARIYAYLCFGDAEHFFNGHPAANLHDDSAAVGALERKVEKLLGLNESTAKGGATSEARFDPPWIKCCLKSYYLQKENPWESRRFRIFGTVLLS